MLVGSIISENHNLTRMIAHYVATGRAQDEKHDRTTYQ